MHTNDLLLDAVIDGEGEALGEASVIGVHNLMNPCVNEQRVNV
jgi:hypothetical protein